MVMIEAPTERYACNERKSCLCSSQLVHLAGGIAMSAVPKHSVKPREIRLAPLQV